MDAFPNFTLGEFLCKCCGGGADIIQPALLMRLQRVRNQWGKPMVVDCGYRCPKHNAEVGGAPDSAHLTGEAADIADPDGSLKVWITDKLPIFSLWMEEPEVTKGWAHLQIRPALNRIFKP